MSTIRFLISLLTANLWQLRVTLVPAYNKGRVQTPDISHKQAQNSLTTEVSHGCTSSGVLFRSWQWMGQADRNPLDQTRLKTLQSQDWCEVPGSCHTLSCPLELFYWKEEWFEIYRQISRIIDFLNIYFAYLCIPVIRLLHSVFVKTKKSMLISSCVQIPFV